MRYEDWWRKIRIRLKMIRLRTFKGIYTSLEIWKRFWTEKLNMKSDPNLFRIENFKKITFLKQILFISKMQFFLLIVMIFILSSEALEPRIHLLIKGIRKFFLNHNKSFRWQLGDYEKHIFSHLKACERRNFVLTYV